MAELKLLAAIRARVAERGMTLTDLARAAGVQPGNLRRMLANTAASPRLGSVMRLLPPLHGRIAPAGARTAAELAVYLDGQRRHQHLDWEQLHDQLGAGSGKIAATFLSEPEKLSLPVVMRLADALHVELSLIDDEAQSVRDGQTKRRPPASPRRPSPRSRNVNPASPSPPAAPPPASPRSARSLLPRRRASDRCARHGSAATGTQRRHRGRVRGHFTPAERRLAPGTRTDAAAATAVFAV